jgi:hypothetical protein
VRSTCTRRIEGVACAAAAAGKDAAAHNNNAAAARREQEQEQEKEEERLMNTSLTTRMDVWVEQADSSSDFAASRLRKDYDFGSSRH